MFFGFSREGVGVHSGHREGVRVDPAPPGAGIVFIHQKGQVTCAPGNIARGGTLCTTLGHVSTVEHLLFAFCACGVTDATVRVRGGEIPILDGSAAPWIRDLRAAGARGAPPFFEVTRPLVIEQGAGRAEVSLAPAGHPGSVEVAVDYPGYRGQKSIPLTPHALEEIAGARTFAFLRDVAAMRASGRIRGGGLHCAQVLCDDGPLTPARGPDEPLDHKLLDAIGDLYILGALPRAHLRLSRPGHRLLHALVRRLAGQLDEQRSLLGARALP